MTILQILNLVSFVTTLVQGGATWAVIVNGILQIAILALLWVGDQTKAFFARR